MPRPRPPHLHRQNSRTGEIVWYVRVGKGPRTRIRGEYGSADFTRNYHAVIQGGAAEPAKTGEETIAWLIERYRASADWAAFKPATRKQREAIFRRLIKNVGQEPISALNRKSIVATMDERADAPTVGNMLLKALRGLFAWALKADLVALDPTIRIKKTRVETEGFAVWTKADIATYQAKWAIGTRERLAFDILYYTGLRRGDAVQFGRQHITDGVGMMRAEKTGQEVYIPILPELAKSIAATPTGDLAFIIGKRGAPCTKESFGTWFRIACRAAGVNKSAHGLRKADATAAAEAGATEAELDARFGWRGKGMAQHYTKAASRKKLEIEAAAKRGGKTESEQSIPSRHNPRGNKAKKQR